MKHRPELQQEALENLKKAAKEDRDKEACYLVGKHLYHKQDSKAFKYLDRVGEGYYSKAFYYLGMCYLKGIGVRVSKLKAQKAFSRAKKYVPAMLELAKFSKHDPEALLLECIEQAKESTKFEKEAKCAQLLLAEHYISVDDMDKARKVLFQCDAPEAYFLIAENFASEDEAFFWYLKGAEAGSSNCQWSLHLIFSGIILHPLHTTKHLIENGDYSNAFTWLEKAANNGHVKAMHKLGEYYTTGAGVKVNQEKAFYWFQKASDAGCTESPLCLGKRYQYGIGTEPNIDKALEFYSLAASRENMQGFKKYSKLYSLKYAIDTSHWKRKIDDLYSEVEELKQCIENQATQIERGTILTLCT